MSQYRQGDLLFTKVNKPNKSGKRMESPILAYGEVTGHAHRIFSPPLSEMESVVDEKGDIFFMSESAPVVISHDEHGSLELPAGQWFCLTRQREYDPVAAERERKVQD